jgi:hypothetical protein
MLNIRPYGVVYVQHNLSHNVRTVIYQIEPSLGYQTATGQQLVGAQQIGNVEKNLEKKR